VAGGRAEGDQVSVEAVEALIRDLPGVLSARLVINEFGGVKEIHVLADTSRPAKAIVRDVESGLLARWGLDVDHKRISVAQLTSVPRRPKWVRLRVQRMTVASDPGRGETEVTVVLAPAQSRDIFGRPVFEPDLPAEEAWEGRAVGDGTGSGGLRLAVTATLQALNRALAAGHSFALDEVGRLALGLRDLVAVVVQYRAPRGFQQLLCGAALVRGDAVEAAVRAALAATNRTTAVALRRRGEDGLGAEPAPDPDEGEADDAAEPAGEA
jgi:hypothetical protein